MGGTTDDTLLLLAPRRGGGGALPRVFERALARCLRRRTTGTTNAAVDKTNYLVGYTTPFS